MIRDQLQIFETESETKIILNVYLSKLNSFTGKCILYYKNFMFQLFLIFSLFTLKTLFSSNKPFLTLLLSYLFLNIIFTDEKPMNEKFSPFTILK